MNDYDKYDPLPELARCIRILAIMLAFTLVVWLLGGCSRTVCGITDGVWLRDTLVQYMDRRDSIYLHDSVFHEVAVNGDTVFVTKDRWHTSYRDRVVHDSIRIHETDTIVRSIEVKKKLTVWQEVRLSIANVTLYAVVIFIVVVFVKWKLKL